MDSTCTDLARARRHHVLYHLLPLNPWTVRDALRCTPDSLDKQNSPRSGTALVPQNVCNQTGKASSEKGACLIVSE